MRYIVGLILLIVWASTVSAVTYYVDNDAGRCPNCNDSRSCVEAQTITTGRDTIGEGMECLSAGDTLEVRGGTYTTIIQSSLHTLNNGTSGSKATVHNYNGEVVIQQASGGCHSLFLDTTISHWTFDGIIWDGRNLGPCGATSATATVKGLTGATNITIKNGTLRHASWNTGTTQAAQNILWGGANLTLQNNDIHSTHVTYGDFNGSHNVYIQSSADDVIVENNTIHDAGGIGVQYNDSNTGAQRGERGIIRSNRIYANLRAAASFTRGNAAIAISSRQRDMLIYNNLIYANFNSAYATRGITLSGIGQVNNQAYNNTIHGHSQTCIRIGEFTAADATLVKNNICANNGEGVRILANATNTVVTQNNIYNHTTPVLDAGTSSTITPNVVGNPLLANAGAGDFHLLATSASINTGADLTSLFTTDFAGTTRTPDTGGDTAWEIGAYTVVAEVLPLKLVFATPPASGTVVGATFTVVVQILDTANTPQDIDSGDITIAKTTGSGTLGGTLTATPTNGVVSFTNLTLDAADDDYTLTVTRASTDPATSAPFTVVAAPSSTVQYFQLR